MAIVEITLQDADKRFIEEAVKSGSYVTQSEVVASALDLLKTHEKLRQTRRAELKKEIAKGLEELQRGETASFETDAFLARMRGAAR